jgi:hypothetical protein
MRQHTSEFVENVMANIVGNSITDGDKLDYLRALLISIVELHEKVDKLTELVKEVKNGNNITGND